MTGNTGLVKVAVSKKDNATYSKTLLLNVSRILDMEVDSSTGLAEFWYNMYPADLKNPAVKFLCSAYTVADLNWACNRSDTTQNRFNIHIMRTRKTGHTELKKDKMVKMWADQLLYAYDKADGLGCYMFIVRGSDTYRWELSHILNDLIRAVSKSASLSRSAM